MSQDRLPIKPAADAPVARVKRVGRSKGKGKLPSQAVRGKMRLKPKVAKVKTVAKRGAPRQDEPISDQRGLRRPAHADEGYVRLRMRVDDGNMSILDSTIVDSTLVQPVAIHGNFAYEVTEGERRLHFDSIPDLGVIRGFVNPDGPPEQRQHHTYEQSVYEFDVRVPTTQLAAATLPHVAIALYRVKEQRPHMMLTARPVAMEYERELREVSRLEGIPPKALPESLRKPRRETRGKR